MRTAAVALCLPFAALAGDIDIARNLNVKKRLDVGGVVMAGGVVVNGTLTSEQVAVESTLKAGTVSADVVRTDILSAAAGDTIVVDGNLELVGVGGKTGTGAGSDAPLSFLAQSVVIDGVAQWRLVSSENFDTKVVAGWGVGVGDASTPPKTSVCGLADDAFVGGHCNLAAGSLTKTFAQLPPHTEVRIKATVNFLDEWHGEQAFAKMDQSYVWLDTVGQPGGRVAAAAAAAVAARKLDASRNSKLNICGGDAADLALGQMVDISKQHSADTLTLEFGTTLGEHIDACEQSWGIDDVQVFVR
jgi:hypothetical protein